MHKKTTSSNLNKSARADVITQQNSNNSYAEHASFEMMKSRPIVKQQRSASGHGY